MAQDTIEEGVDKAFGSHERHRPIHPSLSTVGRANPEVRQSSHHGFLTLQGQYRSKLLRYLNTEGNRPQKQRAAEELTMEYFTKAFRYGLLSRGGLKRTPRDLALSAESLRWLNKSSKEEAGYLIRFFFDKDKLSQAQINRRAEMYVKTLESVFTAGRVSATPGNKFIIIHWVINKRAESCPGCIYLNSVSPFTKEVLPCTPKDGTTQCRSNCKCALRFETVDAARYNQVHRTWVTKRLHLARLGALNR